MIDILLRTLDDTVSAMTTVFIMLFLTGFLVELNSFQRISHLARPLVSISHLPAVSASTFVVSIGSALAANAMIARLKEEGQLSEKQAFLSAIMNSVPVYFREFFTYQLAFVIPVLGLFVGGVYAIISIATGLIKLALVLVLGRAYLPGSSQTTMAEAVADIPSASSASSSSFASSAPSVLSVSSISSATPVTTAPSDPSQSSASRSKKDYRDAAVRSLKGQTRIFLKIAGLYFIMTFLVLYMDQEGILQSLDVTALANFFSVPPETVIPLTIYVASPKAGITLLGPLIQNGGISETKALIVLMLGSLFMLPFYSLRSLLPNYTSVFGMRVGLSLVIVSTFISVMVRISVLLMLLIVT